MIFEGQTSCSARYGAFSALILTKRVPQCFWQSCLGCCAVFQLVHPLPPAQQVQTGTPQMLVHDLTSPSTLSPEVNDLTRSAAQRLSKSIKKRGQGPLLFARSSSQHRRSPWKKGGRHRQMQKRPTGPTATLPDFATTKTPSRSAFSSIMVYSPCPTASFFILSFTSQMVWA